MSLPPWDLSELNIIVVLGLSASAFLLGLGRRGLLRNACIAIFLVYSLLHVLENMEGSAMSQKVFIVTVELVLLAAILRLARGILVPQGLQLRSVAIPFLLVPIGAAGYWAAEAVALFGGLGAFAGGAFLNPRTPSNSLAALRRLPLPARLGIATGPIVVALFAFGWFISSCEQIGEKARAKPVLGAPTSREAIVVVSAGIEREMAALRLLKSRDSSFLFIGGAEPGFDLEAAIHSVWDSAQERERAQARIIWDRTPPTTLAVAQAAREELNRRGLRRAFMVTGDVWMLRSLTQFRLVMPEIEVLPYATATENTPFALSAHNASIYWWEFAKYLIWSAAHAVRLMM